MQRSSITSLKPCAVYNSCRGNGASVIRIIPYAALHYMTYELYRDWILEKNLPLGSGPIVDLVAGSAAGGTAVLCTYPLDLARTKLAYQVCDFEYLALIDFCCYLIENEEYLFVSPLMPLLLHFRFLTQDRVSEVVQMDFTVNLLIQA